MVRSLKRIVSGEKLDIDEEALATLAESADGSFRDGAKLIQELSLTYDKITLSQVLEKVGFVENVILKTFIDDLQKKQTRKLLDSVLNLEKKGKNIRFFFQSVLKYLEQELINLYSGGKSLWKPNDLKSILKSLDEACFFSKQSVIPQLPFELALVEFAEGEKQIQNNILPTQNSKSQNPVQQNKETFDEATARDFRDKWSDIIEKMKPRNNSLSGILRSCRPVHYVDEVLTIEAAYKFHAERMNESIMQALLAQTIEDVVGSKVSIKTVLKRR